MQERRKGGLRRIAIVLTVVAAGVLTVGANAAFAQGTLEICKSTANGMSGRTFEFSIQGVATPVSVRAGRCTGPMTVPHGDIAITELPTIPATEVDSVVVRPTSRYRSLNGNTAVVNVPLGSTAANETRITFYNVPGGGLLGDLKVCKLSETPAYWGRQFSFTVNGGAPVSTEANPAFDDPSTWTCRLLGSFTQGTVVRVQELIPPGSEIAFIDSDPPECLQDFDTNVGWADALIGPGSCVLLFDNEAVAPSGTGFIEVCKDAGWLDNDSQVLGVPFDFTIDEPDQSTQDITVLGGQCSAPIPVAAGVVRVTEHANPGFTLVGVYTIPEERLLDANLINRTADVEVPTSDDPNDESQVHFVNERDRAQLKICKALGPGSSVFLGPPAMSFTFTATARDADGNVVGTDDITIIPGTTTQCVISDDFPTGSIVTVVENTPPPYTIATCAAPGVTITIGAGINTVTCTNTARGKLQICKFITPPVPTGAAGQQRLFYFRIDGGPLIAVRATTCSPPQLVSVGSHTVTEVADNALGGMQDYELDPTRPGNGIDVTPPEAETSRNLLARSVTVNVPWAGPGGNEVRVDYYNRVRRGQIKICKDISPGSFDSLNDKEREFHAYVNGTEVTPTTFGIGLKPGECRLVLDAATGLPRYFPILTGGGPTQVAVRETGATDTSPPPAGSFYVSGLHLQGGRGGYGDNCSSQTYAPTGLSYYEGLPLLGVHCKTFGAGPIRHVHWNLGPNTNTIHFINTSGDP